MTGLKVCGLDRNSSVISDSLVVFFFQAEDGIRDLTVTGVQTCALPISNQAAEALFVLSVLAGYIVLGSLVGSQDEGKFDVFRTATRLWSLLQFGLYVGEIGRASCRERV